MNNHISPIVKHEILWCMCFIILRFVINTTACHLGQYKPSFPPTKELHGSGNLICLLLFGSTHRHLREIDSAVVARLATGAESGGKSIHWTRTWRRKVLHSGCCGWRHNYYSQQRQAGRANEQSTSLRCLWLIYTEEFTLGSGPQSNLIFKHPMIVHNLWFCRLTD